MSDTIEDLRAILVELVRTERARYQRGEISGEQFMKRFGVTGNQFMVNTTALQIGNDIFAASPKRVLWYARRAGMRRGPFCSVAAD